MTFWGVLYPGAILDIPDFVRCSTRLRDALPPHIGELLTKGITVVPDFPGNTKKQLAWCRTLFEQANVAHELHSSTRLTSYANTFL